MATGLERDYIKELVRAIEDLVHTITAPSLDTVLYPEKVSNVVESFVELLDEYTGRNEMYE